MRIYPAKPLHINTVSMLLSEYFSEQNALHAREQYTTNVLKIRKLVSKQILSEQSGYIYILIENRKQQIIGVACLFLRDQKSEVSCLYLIPDEANTENYIQALTGINRIFQARGIRSYSTEFHDKQYSLKQALQSIHIQNISSRATVNI